MSTCTVATEDDFEAVEHNHVPNDGDRVADADDWTITDNPIPNSSSSNRKINHNLNVKVSSDDDEDDDGAPCSVVVVELPASMSQKATGIIDSSEQNVTEFIRKEGNFEDDESLGVSSRSTIASSVIQKLEQWNTKGDSVADKSSNVTDQMKEKQPSISDVKNSDRRTCSTNTHSSNKWSLVEEEKRYRNSGRHENYSDTDYSSVSTWGTTTGGGDCNTNHAVVAAYKNDDDDRTTVSVMGASSTISGFDIISLNGTSSQRACHRCTYLNPHHSLFCEVCEVSLEPNPCPDADAVLAQQLQDDEDKYAFSIVQEKETKRRHMFVKQPLIVQSRAFKRDIYRFMNDFKNRDTASSYHENDKVGYSVLPEVSMVILASRFIETLISNYRNGKNADVLIRYCVTPKLDGLFHEKVKENAFPPDSIFSLEFELALRNNCKPYVTRAFTYPGNRLAGGTATSSAPTNTLLVLPGQPPRAGNTLDSSTLTTNSAPSALAPSAPPAPGPTQPPIRNQVDLSSASTTSSGSRESRANPPGAYQVTRTASGPAQVYRFTVPAGVQPGSEFTVHAGPRRVRIRCPETSQPGQSLQMTLPPGESVSKNVPLRSAPLPDPIGAGSGGAVAMSKDVLRVNEQAKEPGGSGQTYLVTIPPNTYPGMQFEFNAGGQRFRVSCPATAGPGMRVRIIPPVQRDTPEAIPKNQVFDVAVPQGVQRGALGMIPEGSATVPKTTHFTTSTSLSDNLGWIAAIVKGEDATDTWNSDDKCYTRVPNPSQTLPLICFDASLWNTPATKYLFQGMIRVCNDFFDTMQEQIDEDMMRSNDQYMFSGKKKARVQAKTADPEGETADNASMAHHHDDKNDDDPNNMEDDCTTYIYEDDSDDEDDDNDNHGISASNPPPLAFTKYASSSIDDESDSE